MLTKARRLEAASPTGQAKKKLEGRYVQGCHHRCFTCARFVGHRRHCCTGVVGRNPETTPVCHVDFRTGRRENPFGFDGRLMAGQDRFWRLLFNDIGDGDGRRAAMSCAERVNARRGAAE